MLRWVIKQVALQVGGRVVVDLFDKAKSGALSESLRRAQDELEDKRSKAAGDPSAKSKKFVGAGLRAGQGLCFVGEKMCDTIHFTAKIIGPNEKNKPSKPDADKS